MSNSNDKFSFAEKFWSKVEKTPSCWFWKGVKKNGAARLWFKGKQQFVYRISYEMGHGTIPSGLSVFHTCAFRSCVNPAHLVLSYPEDDPYFRRFWSKVHKTGSCWLWKAGVDIGGYGVFTFKGKSVKAHRVSYELAYDPIPEGLFVLHKCDNPPCVNPKHLFVGTIAENNADRNNKGRTVAPKGDKNGARLYPQRCAEGARQRSQNKPESYMRGDNHYYRTNPEKVPRGERHPRALLTADDVRQIRQMCLQGNVTHKSLAKEFDIATVTISAIHRRRIWKHLE